MTSTYDTVHAGPVAGSRAGTGPLEARPGTTVASFRTYSEAQEAVDHLSDEGFPVQDVSIVGHGLTSVERVTGRMTKGRAALAGSATGAWFGLLVGLLFGIFMPGLIWFSVMLTALVLGALWGAVVGFIGHWATRGRRDFTSLQGLAAERYDVVVHSVSSADAARILERHSRA